jgi:hypothetical protein
MEALNISLNGAVLFLLKSFHDTYDKDHSLEYTLEECLLQGIKAKKASKEYSQETNNRKKFEKEIATDPSIIMDQKRMAALCKKYGIGASNAKMNEVLDEIITAPAAEVKPETKPEPAKAA